MSTSPACWVMLCCFLLLRLVLLHAATPSPPRRITINSQEARYNAGSNQHVTVVRRRLEKWEKFRVRGKPGDCGVNDVEGTRPCRAFAGSSSGIIRLPGRGLDNQLTIPVYIGMAANRQSQSHAVTLLLTKLWNATTDSAIFHLTSKFEERLGQDMQQSLMDHIESLSLSLEEKRDGGRPSYEGELARGEDEGQTGDEEFMSDPDDIPPKDNRDEPPFTSFRPNSESGMEPNSGDSSTTGDMFSEGSDRARDDNNFSGRQETNEGDETRSGRPEEKEDGSFSGTTRPDGETKQELPSPTRLFHMFHVNTQTSSFNHLVPNFPKDGQTQVWRYEIKYAAFYEDNSPVPAFELQEAEIIMPMIVDLMRDEIGTVLGGILKEPLAFATDTSLGETDWEFWKFSTAKQEDDEAGGHNWDGSKPHPAPTPAPAPSLTSRSFDLTVEAYGWGLERYLGLGLVVSSLGLAIILGTWSACRSARRAQKAKWGSLANEDGVNELLEMGWALKDGELVVFNKAGVGYSDEDSVFRGGFQQRETIVGAEISVTVQESEITPDSRSFRTVIDESTGFDGLDTPS